MGANLCSFSDQYSSSSIITSTDHHHDNDNDHDHRDDRVVNYHDNNDPQKESQIVIRANNNNNNNNIPRAIMGLIRRPGCLKMKRTLAVDHKAVQKKISKARKLTTLEDWLVIDSPGIELHVLKHSSRKVHPSSSSSDITSKSSSGSRTTNKARDESDNNSTNKSTTKLIKKVRFRDDPHVITFYSPDDDEPY